MAKFGAGGGQMAGAPTTSLMPRPRPAVVPAAGAPVAAQPAAGLFGGMDPKSRYDMVQGLLQSAMSSASQSKSPLLAALAPIAGAMIGAKAQTKYDTSQTADAAATAATLGVPDAMRPVLDIINDPNTPDSLKSIAQAKLKAAMTPATVQTGGGRRSSGRRSSGGSTGGSAASDRLMGEYVGADGNLYGRTRGGIMKPYKDETGAPMKAGGGGKPPKVEADDPLGIMGADPTSPQNDPLGIRQ